MLATVCSRGSSPFTYKRSCARLLPYWTTPCSVPTDFWRTQVLNNLVGRAASACISENVYLLDSLLGSSMVNRTQILIRMALLNSYCTCCGKYTSPLGGLVQRCHIVCRVRSVVHFRFHVYHWHRCEQFAQNGVGQLHRLVIPSGERFNQSSGGYLSNDAVWINVQNLN